MATDYREEIIDHYKHPRNFGELPGRNRTGKGINAACGDMVEFYLKVKSKKSKVKSGKLFVEDVRWRGVGCAMSTASASLLSEWIKGKSVKEVEEVDEAVVEELVGEVNLGRIKCVMLPMSALKEAVKVDEAK